MKTGTCSSKSVIAAIGAGAAVATAAVAVSKWLGSWNATKEDRQRDWPGDELVGKATAEDTHAITIHATPGEIWPWLVQWGQDRGGSYSYAWLENLFGLEVRNADRIIPGHQHRAVGDSVWLSPPDKFNGTGRFVVAQIIPERALVLVAPENPNITQSGFHDMTWALYLEPLDSTHTRLITRGRSKSGVSPIFRMIHFIMERKMLLGIKRLAESTALEFNEMAA
jgi:hypothetical protein